jgi:hypothetical protein
MSTAQADEYRTIGFCYFGIQLTMFDSQGHSQSMLTQLARRSS